MLSRSLAVRAYSGTSFSPEKRADSLLESYRAELQEVEEIIKKLAGENAEEEYNRFKVGYEAKYTAWLQAKSRCISSMIAGPSNFPTRRAQKANDSEHNRLQELIDFKDRAIKAIRRKYTDSGGIRSDDPEALEKLIRKLFKLEKRHRFMVATNKAWRQYAKSGDKSGLVALGISEEGVKKLAADIEKAYSWEKQPFPKWMIGNSNKNIRNVRQRLEHLERQAERGTRERETESGIRVIENPEINRIQIFFPDKPDAETRKYLKSYGYRWAPSNGCWQAYINWRAQEAANSFKN